MPTKNIALFVALGLVFAACDQGSAGDESARTRNKADAGVVTGVKSVDPKLAKAVESASKSPAQSSQATGGPPESGIFAPGRADAELAAAAPPKVVMGAPGNAPRIVLARQPTKAGKWPASLRLRLSAGQGGMPPLNLALSLEVAKPQAPAPQNTADAGVAPAPVKVVAKVLSVDSTELGMALPEEVRKELDKLKGSAIRFDVAGDGGARNFETVLASGANPGLEDVLRGGVDVLALMLVAMPVEPIGAGGYFMVTSRDHEAASDVVTYRMVRVESATDTHAALSMTTRRYAVTNRVELPQASPQPLELERYESQGQGNIEIELGQPFPKSAQVTHQLGALLGGPPGATPGQQLRMQSSTHGQLTLNLPAPAK